MAAITSPGQRGIPAQRRHLRVVGLDERVRGRRSARVYRRRRILAVVVLFAALVLARALVGWLGSGPLSAPEPAGVSAAQPVAMRAYVVQPGDTLWSIARALQPTGDVRPLVQRLDAQLADAPLRPGQRLDLAALAS